MNLLIYTNRIEGNQIQGKIINYINLQAKKNGFHFKQNIATKYLIQRKVKPKIQNCKTYKILM